MFADPNLNFFVELADYFQNQADKLEIAWKTAKIYPNPTDIGDVRANALFDFLSTHLPIRCLVTKGGFIFDSLGNRSKQIDIVITNDQTLQFLESNENKMTRFNCVEGCYGIISVKSHLGKKELVDSLDNLASVSTDKRIIISPLVENDQDLIRQVPQRIVFAYQGDSADTTLKNLKEYYTTHQKGERSPDMIIVNNQFYIFKVGVLGVPVADGSFIKPNEYTIYKVPDPKYAGATSLIQLILRIQSVSNISIHMMIDFDAYAKTIDKAIYEEIKKNSSQLDPSSPSL